MTDKNNCYYTLFLLYFGKDRPVEETEQLNGAYY